MTALGSLHVTARRAVDTQTMLRAAFVIGAGMAIVVAVVAASDQFAYDAHAYWAADPATAYLGQTEGASDTLLYTPPFILLFSAIGHAVAWPQFLVSWSIIEAGAIALMAGPLTLAVLFTPPVAIELTLANIHALMGATVLAGFRWPAAWALILLTKVTPGVGLLWFVFRREWRSLGIALGATAIIALPTMLLFPDLWSRWLAALVANSGGPIIDRFGVPLPLRLGAAVVILWWGARRDARWVVPIAVTLGLPQLWDHGLVILLASIPLAWPRLSLRALFGSAPGGSAPGGSVLADGQTAVVTQ